MLCRQDENVGRKSVKMAKCWGGGVGWESEQGLSFFFLFFSFFFFFAPVSRRQPILSFREVRPVAGDVKRQL